MWWCCDGSVRREEEDEEEGFGKMVLGFTCGVEDVVEGDCLE